MEYKSSINVYFKRSQSQTSSWLLFGFTILAILWSGTKLVELVVMSISTLAGPETFALKKKVSFWHDDVTVLRSLSHLSHYSSSSSGYEGSNESGLKEKVQDGQKVKKKRSIQHITNKNNNKDNKTNIPSTNWPPLPLQPNKDLPPHYSIEHKPALHRVIPKAPNMLSRDHRTGNSNNNNTKSLPLPQIRKSKTYTSGLSSKANHQSGFHEQQEEDPLPPLLLVPEDALDKKRQADSRGLFSVGPTQKKSFGNLSLFIPKLAPKESFHKDSHGTIPTANPEIPRLASHLQPPIQLEIPKKRVSKIPESISLQNFKRAAKGSMFKSAKQEHTVQIQSSRKGIDVDNMEQRPRKIRQTEIRKTPAPTTRPRYSIGEPRHSPVTLRRKLEQPVPVLPIHSQYVQRQQERLKRQSQEDLLQQQTSRVRRQSQEDLRQAQRLRRQSQENLRKLEELRAQRLARRQSQDDLKKVQQERLQRRQSQELLQQHKQKLLERRSREEALLQQQRQRLSKRQSDEHLTPRRTIPDAKPVSTLRRHTTLEEDLKAWKEKYHTIANLPTHLPEPEPVTDDRKKAIAATLNSLKVFKRQSVGPDSVGLAGSSGHKRRPDASNNRNLGNIFDKPEERNQPARARDSRRYKEEEFDVEIPSHPPSILSNQHEDMDGLKLQNYIEMVGFVP